LAWLGGVDSDLSDVIGYSSSAKIAEPHRIRERIAMSVAALISYSRCFTSGVRKINLASIVETAPEQIRKSHEFFTHLRNKHVAHSVNGLEENDVIVEVGPEAKDATEIRDVLCQTTKAVGLTNEELLALIGLATWLREQVNRLTVAAKAKALAHIHTLSLEEVTRVPGPRGPAVFDSKALKMRRSQ
jgi:hypothetical protein